MSSKRKEKKRKKLQDNIWPTKLPSITTAEQDVKIWSLDNTFKKAREREREKKACSSEAFSYSLAELFLAPQHICSHTPSIAFRHLHPNSARFSYATEGAFFISAQLSSDAVRFRRISLESATQLVSDYSLTMPTLLCLYPCYHDPISVSDQGCMYWLHCCIALISWSNCLSIAHAWSVIPYMGSW